MAEMITVNRYFKLRVACMLEQQLGLMVSWHKCIASTALGVTAKEMAEAIDALFEGPMKDWLGTSAEYRGVGVQILSTPQEIEYTSTLNNGMGTGGLSSVAAQVSGCITLQTGLTGRINRGRKYPPFPGIDMVTAPWELSGAGLTALSAIGTVYLDGDTTVGADGTAEWKTWIVDPQTLVPRAQVTNIRANDKLATQRRRGSYGRTNVAPF